MQFAEKFRDILLAGETLVWTGKAGGGFLLTNGDVFMIPFSLVWGAFAFFWEYEALKHAGGPSSLFFQAFAVLIIALALYVMVGRFFLDAYARQRTFYALTEKRLLIIREGVLGSIQSFQFSQLPSAKFWGAPAGTGTVDLSDGTGASRSFVAWTPSFARGARLLKIENAWQVFTLIQQAQERLYPVKNADRIRLTEI